MLSIAVYIDSDRQKMPKWWAPLLFFAPAATPLYLIKTRKKESLVPMLVFVLIFLLVGIGEGFLFTRFKKIVVYENYSPAVRQVVQMAYNLRDVVDQLNDKIGELDDTSGVGASPESIEETLVFIRSIQRLLDEYIKAIDLFNLSVNEYQERLISEKLGWILYLQKFYKEKIVIKYLRSLDQYLEAFASMLDYTKNHFWEIQSKQARARKNYDTYYLNYVRALERHERLDVGRMRFQHLFMKQHPQLEDYLPSMLKHRFIDIWQKN